MSLFAWLFRLALFGVIFWVALKNTELVPLRLGSNFSVEQVPLVVVILVSVCVGVVAAILALLPTIARMRHRIALLAKAQRGDGAELDRAGERLAAAARNVGAVGEIDPDSRLRR